MKTKLAEDRAKIGPALARTASFELLESNSAHDVRAALRTGLAEGVLLANGTTPLAIFRQALASAIGRIHEDDHAPLFLRFLKDGPYEDGGDIPPALQGKRLTDDECASVIKFIYSHMVNCFKGALAEMLAVLPCLKILRQLQAEKRLPHEAGLYVGDAVWSSAQKGSGFAKGADLHMLVERRSPKTTPSVVVGGVIEVKSFSQPMEKLQRQLDQHLARAREGLRVGKIPYDMPQIIVGSEQGQESARVTVLPAHWALPRGFRFEHKDGRKFLHVDPAVPQESADKLERKYPLEWHVTLRWWKEALDAAAYGMTFWFMEKVGEALYTQTKDLPKEWEGMTPAEAGQNAAKMMLYYAILRCRTARENQRAIALYNSYGFGYMLGMNFRNVEGKREMLWPQDLDEILKEGATENGCKIV